MDATSVSNKREGNMRITAGAVMAGLSCLLLTASVGLCANAPAPGKATLSFQLGAGNFIFASRVISNAATAGKMSGGGSFSLQGPEGKIDIGGQSISVAVQATPKGVGLGVDCKCKGSIDPSDYRMIKDASASFVIKLPDGDKTRDLGVTFTDLSVSAKGTAISAVFGKVTVACCMKGTIAGTDVRLLDENLDGKFTQDGQDSIIVGNAGAVPLLKKVCIGTAIYELTASGDGKTIDYAPQTDVKTGTMELPIKSPALKCLVFASADGAFDLVAQTKIPEGQYHFVYGLLAQGKDVCSIQPSTSTPTYDIPAGSNSKLLFGPTYNVDFSAKLADGKVTIAPFLTVTGAGNEIYGVNIKTVATVPHVVMLEGDKPVSDAAMGFG